jgi:hypothetical protein
LALLDRDVAFTDDFETIDVAFTDGSVEEVASICGDICRPAGEAVTDGNVEVLLA